jgi:hypothetical protein
MLSCTVRIPPAFPSAHDNECPKENRKENQSKKKTKNQRSKIKLACLLAEQMKTQDA